MGKFKEMMPVTGPDMGTETSLARDYEEEYAGFRLGEMPVNSAEG